MERKKILVIEDEVDFSRALRAILEAEGFEVHTALTGKEGLASAKSVFPDLIVLDVMLPEIDGYKICRLLKFDERYKKIPIIMLTARAQEEDKALGQQTGADVYLVKGQRPEILIGHIKRILSQDQDSPETSS
ncbi:MAG: response regulator [Candidatus Omnitrophota bacterium]